jgi:hypothetical protein
MKEQEADTENHEMSEKNCAFYFVHRSIRKMKQA